MTSNPLTGCVFSPRNFELVDHHLPIHSIKGAFITALNTSQVILIESAPGTGKSTLIPKWAVEAAANGRVACARPRRAAAAYLAARLAEEMEVRLGEEVGYATREANVGGSRLLCCTNGWLLEKMKQSPRLDDYGVVIVDEVQERTIHVDVLLFLLRELIKTRKDVRIVIVGSDASRWKPYFESCSLLQVPTSPSTVEIVYTPLPHLTYLEAAVKTVVELHSTEQSAGAILLFLATNEDVVRACEEISKRVETLGEKVGPLDCIPLHSALTADELQRIHYPAGNRGRKCVISTQIGESSIVFDGVAFVIDTGFRELDFYEVVPSESTSAMPISKVTADLRAQRASEKAIRLYSQETYAEMEEETKPAIRRANPEQVKEMLKEFGVEDLSSIGIY